MNQERILVWDLPVRVFHWLLVLCFAGAWLTSEFESLETWHLAFGYTSGALIVFRLLWGLVGTRYARFSSFVAPPRAVIQYLFSLFGSNKKHYLGHNPAGGAVMLSLMILVLLVVFSGYVEFKKLVEFDDLHEGLANLCLALVGAHVTAAVLMSWLEKENLVKSMLDGMKAGRKDDANRHPMVLIGMALLFAAIYFFVVILSGDFPSFTQPGA